jgi:hypothetical protein
MRRHILRLLVMLAASPAAATAADPLKVERGPAEEPAYRGEPKYCLLAFGPEAKARVWAVRDDNALYVDLNGNGDLTEKGERFEFPVRCELADRDGKAKVTLEVKPQSDGRTLECQVALLGRYIQYARLKPADRAKSAPVYHFLGPLRIQLRTKELTRGAKAAQLEAAVGTPQPDGSWVFVSHEEGVPDKVHPLAEVEFPGKRLGDPPVKVRVPLTHRC